MCGHSQKVSGVRRSRHGALEVRWSPASPCTEHGSQFNNSQPEHAAVASCVGQCEYQVSISTTQPNTALVPGSWLLACKCYNALPTTSRDPTVHATVRDRIGWAAHWTTSWPDMGRLFFFFSFVLNRLLGLPSSRAISSRIQRFVWSCKRSTACPEPIRQDLFFAGVEFLADGQTLFRNNLATALYETSSTV